MMSQDGSSNRVRASATVGYAWFGLSWAKAQSRAIRVSSSIAAHNSSVSCSNWVSPIDRPSVTSDGRGSAAAAVAILVAASANCSSDTAVTWDIDGLLNLIYQFRRRRNEDKAAAKKRSLFSRQRARLLIRSVFPGNGVVRW